MFINYDRNPSLSAEQKLDSLVESIQLSMNEIESRLRRLEIMIEEMKRRDQQ